jgi:chaperonin GroEL (HSP60 family)
MATGQSPSIASIEELRLYVKHSIRDEVFATLLMEIFQKIGGGGAIQIKKGGDGSPYSVEYNFSERPKHMSRGQVSERMEELKSALSEVESAIEEVRLQEELAELTGASAIIWVNSSLEQELDKAKRLLQNAMEAIDRAVG